MFKIVLNGSIRSLITFAHCMYLVGINLGVTVHQMIKSKVGSIKSGWRSVFMIFTAAADDETESIAESAFENVEQGMYGSLL